MIDTFANIQSKASESTERALELTDSQYFPRAFPLAETSTLN